MLHAILTAALLMSSPAVLAADPPAMVMLHGTALRPLAGQRYQKMRALGRYLDATAQGALEGAVDDGRHRARSDASFLFSIRAFARSSADFHHKLDLLRGGAVRRPFRGRGARGPRSGHRREDPHRPVPREHV